jgi:hypothetical protein
MFSGTPVAQFQWTIAEKEDTWRLVRDINQSLSAPHNQTVLEGHFKSEWPRFKRKLDRILEEAKEVGSEHVQSDEEDQSPPLSTEAQDLLIASASDPSQKGVVMMLSFQVQGGSKAFADPSDPRSIATWRGVVEELFGRGLLEDRGGKHEVFFLTGDAYKIVDQTSGDRRQAAQTPCYDDNDIISVLESWMAKRSEEQNTAAIEYADVDKELNLPSGSALKHLEQAAQAVHYIAERKGANTIKFKKVLPPSDAPSYSNPSVSQRASRYFGSH